MHRIIHSAIAVILLVVVILMPESMAAELSSGWRHNYQRELVVTDYYDATRPLFYVDASGNYWKALGSALNDYRLSGKPNAQLVWDTTERAWTLEQGGQRDIFNETGRLERIMKNGRETTLQYDPDTGRLATVTSHTGRQLQFEYTDGLLTAVIRPDGERITYEYEETAPPINSTVSGHRLTRVNYPDGTNRQYHYEREDFQNHLTGITDENGDRFSTFEYDSAGQVIGSEHAGGVERVHINRRSDGTTVITDPMGQQSTYRYIAVHNYRKLASVDGGPCATCSNSDQARTYDGNGYVKTRTDFGGTVTQYQRDSFGRELSRTEAVDTPEQRTITTEWDTQLNVPIRIAEPGRTTEYTYDGNGNRLTETVTDTATGESRTTSWTYNDHGQVLTVDGPRIDVTDATTYTYDAEGNLATVTNALGHVTEYTQYDAHGNPLEIVDPNGVVTELEYDLRQRLVRRTVAAGTADAATTTFDYDPVGQLIRTTLPDGAWVAYEYDAAHRMTAIEDSAGNRIDYTLDAMGNRIEETVSGPYGSVIRETFRDYNQLNRLAAEYGPEGTRTEYGHDAEGNRTSATDALNNTTEYRFDALNRLFETIDALSGVTSYEYDPRDNLTQVVDPRGVTTDYTYNGFNELLETDSPDAGTTTYTYDAAGNRITQTDAHGITVQYQYDALNRLTFIDYPSSMEGSDQDIRYEYDALPNAIGRLVATEDETGRTEYAYDARGNLVGKTVQVENVWLPLTHAYDAADRIVETIYPDNTVIRYQRDAHGRVTDVVRIAPDGTESVLLDDIGYAPFGPQTDLAFGNGLSETRSFDREGRITGIRNGNVLDYGYQWDTAGNIAAITDNLDAARNQTFGYDALSRLASAGGIYGNLNYQYDAVGNRTGLTENGIDTVYTYATDSNRLMSIAASNGSRLYDYDANGNTLDDGEHGYDYDNRNRLKNADDVNHYKHNALDQRAVKTTPDGTTLFLYDEAGHLLGEYDATGDPIRQYAWLGDRPVAMLAPGGGERLLDDDTAVAQGNWQTYTHVDAEGGSYQSLQPDASSLDGYIIDNTDALREGNWNASTTNSGYYGSNYHYSSSGASNDRVTYDYGFLPPGRYHLYAWWSDGNSRGTVTYTVNHAAGSTDQLVHQKYQGGSWNLLGSYDNPQSIVLTDAGSGNVVVADAVLAVPVANDPATYLDNTQAVFNGSWSSSNNVSGYYRHDYRYSKSGSARFDIATAPGEYRLYTRWTAASDRTTEAVYTVNHASGTDIAVHDQRTRGGKWHLLGQYQSSGNISVDITNNQLNKNLVIDAIKLEPVDLADANLTWDIPIPNTGSHTLQARWIADAQNASDATWIIHHPGGQTATTVNQKYQGNEWIDLATLDLNPGDTVTVELLGQGNGTVTADAIRMTSGSGGDGQVVYYIHSDHLNTPQAVTDENQGVVWKADYKPFGEAEPTVTTLDMPLRFPGQIYDTETNLHYNYFRTYDPRIGRYTESDPIGLLGGLNTYLYAGSDPISMQDPYGLAYFAKRPLSGAPWFGTGSHNSGSVDDRMNTEISHEHIFFEDGKSPANIGFGPNGLFTETNPQGYRTTDGGYDDCIMRIAVERAPVGEYCLLGIGGAKNNCQDWAERARRIYHRIKNDLDVKQKCDTCQ